MSVNPKVLVEAATIKIPATFFAAAATTALAKTNITKLTTLLTQEETNHTGRVGWLDEMTPAARITMIAYLQALHTSIT